MNNLLTSAYGIDVAINDVQKELYNSLVGRWNGDIEGYGRIHKNKKSGDNYLPEHYLGKGQYKEVYYDNKLGGDFFFIVGDEDSTEDQMVFTSKVKCVFMVNLDNIYSDKERSDVKAQKDALEILRKYDYFGYVVTGITKTVKSIFTGFDTSKIGFTDIQPAHCFSINIDLSYYLTDKCE
ncbi:MAG: hypothetical protein ABFS35_17805 [Bacteroidota bacterium]